MQIYVIHQFFLFAIFYLDNLLELPIVRANTDQVLHTLNTYFRQMVNSIQKLLNLKTCPIR